MTLKGFNAIKAPGNPVAIIILQPAVISCDLVSSYCLTRIMCPCQVLILLCLLSVAVPAPITIKPCKFALYVYS